MTNPTPQVGDLISATIINARVTEVVDESPLGPQVWYTTEPHTPGGNPVPRVLFLDSPSTTVVVTEPTVPAAWPPRLGDLWRDKDQELWFATTAHRYRHGPDDFPAVAVVELVHAGGGPSRQPDEVNREFGPFTLVRREDTADPASPVKDTWPPQIGTVWRDSDDDEWTAEEDAFGGVMMRLHLDGRLRTPDFVQDNFGPLTFVRREQAEDQP